MARAFNFSAGPATLPLEVLEQAQKELLDYNGSGMSIMEHSHRGKDFDGVINEAVANVKEIWNIPDNYKVLFLQGGASSQFFMAPMNLAKDDQTVDYIVTGSFAEKSLKEAKILNKKINIAFNTKEENHIRIPNQNELNLTKDAAYVHITSNNTIYGTQYSEMPETNGVPIVADMSSDILSKYIDWKNIGLIYAGAQKNLGPAGATLVIIRDDLVERSPAELPSMLKYSTFVEKNSMYNTPPTFSIYMINLVFNWIKSKGGIDAINKMNIDKSNLLYEVIDSSGGFYQGHAQKESRSVMNVSFKMATKELDAKFVEEASKIGLKTLKGHRSIGGIRASIYNAMPKAGCEKLAEFMKNFQKNNG